MHAGIVVTGIPNPTSSGGNLTAWSVIHSLLTEQHDVTVFIINNTHISASQRSEQEQIAQIEALGARTVIVSDMQGTRSDASKWRRMFFSRIVDYYPMSIAYNSLASAVRQQPPDVLFIYHFDALSVAYQIDDIPKMVVVGDPTHLPDYYRWQYKTGISKLKSGVGVFFRNLYVPPMMATMLNVCTSRGAFAGHHARWLGEQGVKDCHYYQTPMPDSAGEAWQAQRESHRTTAPKIVLIGHLRGIATVSGLYPFFQEALPVLENELDNFEIHVIGSGTLPDDLADYANHPNVIMRGQVEPADDEFLSADVIVVPTPIELGIRVRIITSMSFGCPIVTHEANTKGIPELQHEVNALIAADGNTMGHQIVEVIRNQDLKALLEAGARHTFETYFSLETAGQRIVKELERIY